MKYLLLIIYTCLFSISSFALIKDPAVKSSDNTSSKKEVLKWVGITQCSSHTTDHNHDLTFIRESDQKEFDIVDSKDITDLHCKNEGDYLVEIEGEKTSRFLFWGGNLKINSFKIIKRITQNRIPHTKPAEKTHSRASSVDRIDRRDRF